MKRNQIIELKINKLAYGGKGVSRIDNQVVFVGGCLPGDEIVAKIRKVKSNYVEAHVVEITKPSPLRRTAECKYFGSCGGCKWQDLEYEQQLEIKREQVRESLEHLAGVSSFDVQSALPSPLKFAYRNKMEFSFTNRRWLTPAQLADPENKKDFGLGLHVPGGFDRVMNIEKCYLQDDVMNGILDFSQDYFRRQSLPVFDLKTHEGVLRFLVLRKSFSENKYMVNIVTFRPAGNLLEKYVSRIREDFPQVTSIMNTVNRRFAQIAFGEETYCLYGETFLREKIGEFEFEISANSFFQTNPLQAKNLFDTVIDFVGGNRGVIWDLFSGTGTIAMFLAKTGKKVVGYELVQGAVNDAYANCERNNVKNCEFVAGDIRENIKDAAETPDVIVCDPPRSGMHPEVVKSILELQPKEIVYVSCNPTTFARDVKILLSDYSLTRVQPVDMFPHTYHIELVGKLELR